MNLSEAYRKAGIERVYQHQEQAWESLTKGMNIIVSAGTGSGKTEAVLLPALANNLRVILVYPTKALLQDQISRVQELWEKVRGRSVTGHISIDTGDDNDGTRFRADVILTTIDKLLYRVFGYGSARWGYIYPWRIAQNPQKKTLLVFDEAHAYDEIPLTHFLFLIDRLTYEKRVQTAVLSATLPKALVEHLQDSQHKTFPRDKNEGDFFQVINEEPGDVGRGVVCYCGHLENRDRVVEKAIEAYRQGKQVIIVANRVYPSEEDQSGFSVQGLWEAIKAKLSKKEQEDLLLYHGHQSPGQRRDFLQKLSVRDASRNTNAPQPYILITTSAFEVGVNISCDLMLVEVCNPDAFIQRIGRCARRQGEKGKVYTFGEIFPKASPEEKKAQEELLELLRQHKDKIIDANLKAQINALNIFDNGLLARRRNTIIYTVDASLYDYVYNFVATGAEVWRQGILVTRDWVPTIELQPGTDAGERLRLPATYSVPQNFVQDWWFETRDVDGRPIRIHGKKEDVVEQLREHGIGAQQGTVNACQATLVIRLKPEAWDKVFGLKRRQDLTVKREFAGLQGIRRCLAKPLPDAPQLFWFEPEDEV
jgi:CRISPR-associated endonuclease/helicase Cas3